MIIYVEFLFIIAEYMPATNLIQSLTRGLAILELLAAVDEGMTLAEVAAASGLKAPTAHNLLRTLAARGYVEKTSPPLRYRVGPAVARLAGSGDDRQLLRRVEAAMLTLGRSFPDATVNFAQPVGGEVVTTLRVAPELPGRPQRDLTSPMPPYTSASALLFQAFWPAEVREAYRRRYPFAEFGGHAWADLPTLDRYLDTVRRAGLTEPVLRDDHYRIAAPVFTPRGGLAGVLGAYLPEARRTAPDRLPVLRQAVREAAEAIGLAPVALAG